jgi:hypothetical protein
MKKKYPDTLYDLIDIIVDEIPEALQKREELFALVKTYIHGEKYMLWKDLDHWVDDKEWVSQRIIKPKIKTHGKDGWYNFEKNLEWVHKYHPGPSNTERYIREEETT